MEVGEQPRIARRDRWQELESNGLLQLQIVSAIDLPHATATDETDDPVAVTQERAWRKPPFTDLARRRASLGVVEVVRCAQAGGAIGKRGFRGGSNARVNGADAGAIEPEQRLDLGAHGGGGFVSSVVGLSLGG